MGEKFSENSVRRCHPKVLNFHIKKGIYLMQNKEPALSKGYREFIDHERDIKYINGRRQETALATLSVDGIMSICEQANITDDCDNVLLYQKLLDAKNIKIEKIMVDAIDDEPYISTQTSAVLHMPEDVVGGLEVVKKILDCKESYIAIYKEMGEISVKIPKNVLDIPVKKIGGKYPTRYYNESDVSSENVLRIGATTLIHLYRAIKYSRIQTTAFITVAGSCIYSPVNMEVPLGMTVTQILQRCGVRFEPIRIVVGGSMTGVSITDTDSTVITSTTRAVLAFKEQFKKYNLTCIGCGKCISDCPINLSPMYIYKYIQSNLQGRLKDYDVSSCIGCGICTYVCPAKLSISDTIYRYARQEKVKKQKQNILKDNTPNSGKSMEV